MAGADESGKVHSKIGASSAERWTNCPGSVAACEAIPDPGSSPAARRGSALHDITERCVTHALEPTMFLGKDVAPWSYKITEQDCDDMSVAVDFVREFTDDPRYLWGCEQDFALDLFDADLFGTNDFWAYCTATRVLAVVDYKFGHGAVEAVGNKQVRFYALGAMLKLGQPVERIDVFVIQPTAALKGGNPIKHEAVDPGDLFEFGGFLAERAEATRQPGAPRKAGEWCKFCRAASTCEALAAEAQAVAGAEFADTLEPDDVAAMDAATLGDRLARAEILEAWLDALRTLARSEAFAGRVPPGHKLVATRGRRKFADGMLAMRQASRQFNVGEDTLFERKPLSPNKFEKAVKPYAEKKAIGEFVKAYLAPAKTGYVLVPASDKRAAVDPSTISGADFSDIGSDLDDAATDSE